MRPSSPRFQDLTPVLIRRDARRLAMQASKTSSTAHEDSTMTDTDPRMPTILRRPQVERRTGLSRSTLYLYIQDGHFPRPLRLGPRAVGWLESDVSAWIAGRRSAGTRRTVNATREGTDAQPV
jgi:prophage regulatory protein